MSVTNFKNYTLSSGLRKGSDFANISLYPIVTTNLVLYYDFSNPSCYPGSGTQITDLSSNGNNGTLVNGAAYTGSNGGIIDFDGTNDYISTLYTGTSTRSITYTIWVNLDVATGFISYMGQDTSVAIDRGQFYFITAGATVLGMINRYADYQFPSPGNTDIRIVNDGAISPANTWLNFTATISSTQLKFYRNGILQNTTNNTNALLAPSGTLVMAASYYTNVIGDFLNGKIGEAYIYHTPLTDAQVLSNFNATKTRYGL
jgi:hypothetical protein